MSVIKGDYSLIDSDNHEMKEEAAGVIGRHLLT
jgi:hypothetical protein